MCQIPLEPNLSLTIWVVKTECRSITGAVFVPNHSALSPASLFKSRLGPQHMGSAGTFVVCLSSWGIQLHWRSPDNHQFLNSLRYDLPLFFISEFSSISGTRIFQLSISIGNLGYNLSAAWKNLKNFYKSIPYFQSI